MLAAPHHSAAWRMAFSLMPVTSAVRFGVHWRHVRRDLLEADGVLLDERMIEPVVFDHQVQDAVKQGDVAAGLDGQEQIAGARQRCDARIDDDDLAAVLAACQTYSVVIGAHSPTFAPLIQTTSALGMSDHGLAARSMPKAFLLPAAALTMHRRPL